jgi:DNA-binding NarL/FixJ family response regulator
MRLHARWGARAWDHPLHSLDSAAATSTLTRREREVLTLVAAGDTNRDIAAALHLSVHTVERHVANIFLKLGTRTRAEAAAWAHRNGLVG